MPAFLPLFICPLEAMFLPLSPCQSVLNPGPMLAVWLIFDWGVALGTGSLDVADRFPLVATPLPSRRSPDSAYPTSQTLNYTVESSGPAQPIRNSCSLGCCCSSRSQRGPESQLCRNCFLASNPSSSPREAVYALGLEFIWVPPAETLVDSSIWVQHPDV